VSVIFLRSSVGHVAGKPEAAAFVLLEDAACQKKFSQFCHRWRSASMSLDALEMGIGTLLRNLHWKK